VPFFARIFGYFANIFIDFARLFDKSKLLAVQVRLHPRPWSWQRTILHCVNNTVKNIGVIAKTIPKMTNGHILRKPADQLHYSLPMAKCTGMTGDFASPDVYLINSKKHDLALKHVAPIFSLSLTQRTRLVH